MKREKKSDSLTIRMTPVMKWRMYLVSIKEDRTMTDLVEDAITVYLDERKEMWQKS